MPTKFVTNPRRPAAKKSRVPMRRNYASASTADNYLRDLRPAQVAQMVREGSLAITHADIGNDYHTVTLFEDGAGGNRRRVEAKWFVPGEEWYDLSLGLRDGKVDPSTADLFLGPSEWDKREREEQTRAAAKRKGITIDASRHYFNNPRRPLPSLSRSEKKAYIDLVVVGNRRNPRRQNPSSIEELYAAYKTANDAADEAYDEYFVAREAAIEAHANETDASLVGSASQRARLADASRAARSHEHATRYVFNRATQAANAAYNAYTAAAKKGNPARRPAAKKPYPRRSFTTVAHATARRTFKPKTITRKRLLAAVDKASIAFWSRVENELCPHADYLDKDDDVVVASEAYMLDAVEKWVRDLGFRMQSTPRRRNGASDRMQRATEGACIEFWVSIEASFPEVYDRMERTPFAYASMDEVEEFNGEMLKFVKKWYAEYCGASSRTNPRRKNPPKGFRIAGPAVKTLVDGLRISKADAQKLKDMMDTGAPRILQTADKMMNGNGVERISGVGGGLMYVNMGDTYDTTLIYDYKTNRFVVSSWGDIVERQPRRFAD
jgi:hypothetical protein